MFMVYIFFLYFFLDRKIQTDFYHTTPQSTILTTFDVLPLYEPTASRFLSTSNPLTGLPKTT